MTKAQIIVEAIQASGWSISIAGGRLALDGVGDLPETLVEDLREHREQVLSLLETAEHDRDEDHAALVAERVAAFSRQAVKPGGQPLFVLPGAETATGCISCGRPLDGGLFRCPACAEAARLVLGLRLEPDAELVAALHREVEGAWRRAAVAQRPAHRALAWLQTQARGIAPGLAAPDAETLVLRVLGRLCNGPEPGAALAREAFDQHAEDHLVRHQEPGSKEVRP